jgi:uncharacterized protein with PIN domain
MSASSLLETYIPLNRVVGSAGEQFTEEFLVGARVAAMTAGQSGAAFGASRRFAKGGLLRLRFSAGGSEATVVVGSITEY